MARSEGPHRCPRCGAGHAERRTPRTLLERAAVALTGHRPYRCLDCGRRFHDRPGQQARGREAEDPPARAPLAATPPAPTVEITSAEEAGPRRRRRPRWVVDPGNSPLARIEVYVIVGLIGLLLLAAVVALRLSWPASTGGVRTFD